MSREAIPTRSRKGVIALTGITAIAAGIVIALSVANSGDEQGADARASQASDSADLEPAEARVDVAGASESAPSQAAQEAMPDGGAGDVIAAPVEVRSTPAAQVFDGEDELGTTPLQVEVLSEGTGKALRLVSKGFEEATVTISASDQDGVDVDMVALKTVSKRRAKRPRSGKDKKPEQEQKPRQEQKRFSPSLID